MAKNIIMPALGISQDSGKVLRWLKAEGQMVTAGEPLLEIETDKASAEIEAPVSGILGSVTAREGDEVPVARVIAVIFEAGEQPPAAPAAAAPAPTESGVFSVTPVAARLAKDLGVDVRLVKPQGGRIEKGDVLAYSEAKTRAAGTQTPANRAAASPKARRLAAERGIALSELQGSGPGGAVLAADVPEPAAAPVAAPVAAPAAAAYGQPVNTLWRIMAERVTQSWTSVPHFYLLREVNASRLIAWRESAQKRAETRITYTDLLVKVAAAALRQHGRINGMWKDGTIEPNAEINIGLAMAVEDGLVVPVIQQADRLTVGEIAARRLDLVTRAQAGKLRPADIAGGTFTLSNLGMYGVDVFNAIVNPPQAALLAVGRIAERVVPVKGQPGVQPMLTLSLSCDHRVVDGARGAQFLDTLAGWIEEPLGLL